jgi:hypothetical protein
MDKTTLQHRANRLRGASAMGGFVITNEQAERAVLRSEDDARTGKALSFEQARAEVRQLNASVLKLRR